MVSARLMFLSCIFWLLASPYPHALCAEIGIDAEHQADKHRRTNLASPLNIYVLTGQSNSLGTVDPADARQTGVKTIDLYEPLADHGEWFPDHIHPNAAGARNIAKVVAGAVAPDAVLNLPERMTELATTSFEKCKAGGFTQIETSVGRWTAQTGHAEIDAAHRHSGRQCLHLLGGEKHSVVLEVKEDAQPDTSLTFHAERWTGRSPFTFRVEQSTVDKPWVEIYNGDQAINVGGFRTHVVIRLKAKPSRLRFTCTSPARSGILIDELGFLLPGTP